MSARRAGVSRLPHLTARFFTSLRPRSVPPADIEWVQAALTADEFAVWSRLGNADRAEAVTTARRLPPEYATDERWRAAALLHDVGKADAHLGVFGRAFATATGWVRDPDRLQGRFGTYLRHPAVGAEALRRAGARPEAVAWAAVHHDPAAWPGCAIPPEVCEALARADGEPVRA